jgi:HEAT repeat protein
VKTLLILLLTCGWAVGARAEITTNATYDELFYAATRYGNTEARRAEKEAARTELFRRGADSLREAMERMHFENVMLQVLAMEMVHDQIPATTGRPVLLDYIEHERMETRRAAIYFLGFYPAPERPARLLKALDDEKTRNAAVRTLGQWKVDRARAELCRLLKTSEAERTRVLAANALRDIGNPDDLPALLAALNDPVFTVRNTAARAVASYGFKAHRPLLRELRDSEGAGRRQIVRLLGELRVLGAVRPLRRLLDQNDPGLRADVERALRQLESSHEAAGDPTDAERLFGVP